MLEPEERWTIKEIAMATKINEKTLHARRRDRGIPANRSGYTLEEVKIMIKRPRIRVPNQAKANQLRAKLLNDGAL